MSPNTMKTKDVDISEESRRELARGVLKRAAHRELAAGVLKQAACDLQRFDTATSKIQRELYLDAYRWLTADECSSPFSFLNICQLLNLAPENVRQELIGTSSGTVDYWTQRCTRAARRVQTSFTQLFPSEHNAGMPVRHAEAET